MPLPGGANKTYAYTATALDQYDDEVSTPATWAAADNTDSAHVTFEDGTLTVADGATKGATIKLTATVGGVSKDVTVTVTDLEVNWEGVSAKGITYGGTNASAITLPVGGNGTATAGDARLEGTFTVQQGDTVQAVGDRTVTVVFTVTTTGDYKGVTVTRDFDVAVAQKPVTVKADNKSKAYGEANPALTFTVPSGALVGQDTKDDLAVTLTCAADRSSPAGTPVDITGTGAAVNYAVTVTKGSLTINKADITAITTQAPAAKTILANAAENTSLDALQASLSLPTQAAVSYSGDQTADLPLVWTADKAFVQTGAAYTFIGKVTVNGNFNTSSKTLTATLTVTPVKLTAIEGVPTALTLSKAQVTGAASLTALGLPANVTLKFDGGVADQSVSAVYDKTLANIQTVANSVTASADKTVDVALTTSGFPAWATLEAALPKATLTITNKYAIPGGDITFADISTTFGTPYTPAATVADKPEYAEMTFAYTYTKDGEALSAAPTDAGTYTVTVTAENANYKGTKSATLTIAPKSIAGATVALPEGFSATYNKAEHQPTVTVKDGETALVLSKDYTVSYANNVNAGTATVIVTGKGNYDEATSANTTFPIAKASLAELKPTIMGTAEAGKTLTAQLDNVAAEEIVWTWTVGGQASADKTDNTYTVALTDSNKAVSVKATAVDGKNYDGSTLDSDPLTVAKVTVTGSVTVTKTNGAEGEEGKIEVGDTLTAIASVTPAVDLTYQWFNNGVAIENATEVAYLVQEGDGKLTVTATPGEDYAGSLTSVPVEVGKSILKGSVTLSSADDPLAVGSTLTATIAAGAATEADYVITWLRDGVEITGATGTEYTIAKADQGKTIAVKVTGAGENYTGEMVSNALTVPAAKPDAPTVSATGGNGQITVTWTVPADNGSPISSYTVQLGDEPAIDVTADVTSHTFTDLTNGTAYTVKVCAINAIGASDAGEATATPKAPTPPPSTGGGNVPADDVNTETRPDGTQLTTVTSPDGTQKVTTVAPNGDKMEVTTKPDGSATGTVTNKDGSTATVTTTAEGETTAQVTVPAQLDKTVLTIPAQGVTPGTVAVIVKEDGTEEIVRTSLPCEDGLTLAITESATVKLVDNAKRFVDMTNHWANNEVDFVTARALFQGTSDTTFTPAGDMTRGMLVTVLFRLDGEHAGDVDAAFSDVAAGTWYTDAVAWANAQGIVTGYSDTAFGPDDNVTREQLAVMIYRYAKALDLVKTTKTDLPFADADSISEWATEAVSWLTANGILIGKPGNLADPTGNATRAEVSAVLERFVEFAVK